MQKYLVLFLGLFLSQNTLANRVGFSDEKWIVQHTPHFEIHHSAQQQDLGLYYAQIAETAYANLAQVFNTHPAKIKIVINDSTDNSNGYATVIPYPLIMIYPVQISNQETLSEAGEWARELLTHELTHIFQMYPYHGVYDWIRPVFGTIVSPNLISPSWWKEGMSIEMETQFSPQGRSRSNFQNATLRSLVYDDQLMKFSLAEANETLKTWPYGNRPYFFGSMIMSEIANDGGLGAINHIVERQSERAPYFIEQPLKEAIERSYQNQFYKTIETQTQISHQQIALLKTQPLTQSVVIDDKLLSSRSPRYNKNLQILALIGLKKSGPEILFYNWSNEQKKFVVDTEQKKISGSIGGFEFHPVEPLIVYSKIDAVNSKQEFSDLYTYDLSTQKTKQITHSERAREPQFSEDGTSVLYIVTGSGVTELKILNLKEEKITSIYKTSYQDRMTQALFINKNEILLDIRDKNGEQKLKIINLTHQKEYPIETPHKQVRFIKKFGQKLYFTDTANGVSNIYSTDLQQKLFAVTHPETHLLTGSLNFDVTDDKFFVGLIGSSGLIAHEIERSKQNSGLNFKLPVIENPIALRYKFSDPKPATVAPESKDYSVWPSILPHYWIPYAGTSSSNKGYFVQAQTSGNDPLNIHTYQASLIYESDINKLGFNFNYVNSSFDWNIQASALQSQKSYGTVAATILQKNSYALGVLPDVFQISENLSVGIGGLLNQVDDGFTLTEHFGGYVQTAYKNFDQKVFQYYPMSGWGGAVKIETMKAQKNLGANLADYTQATGTASGYFSKWLPEDHALMFKVDGLYTFDNVSSRFGVNNTQFPTIADGLVSQFALRGYSSGQFFGSQLFTGTAEYRFPIKNIHKGSGTDPLFIKTLTGAVVVDGLATKGFGVNEFNSFIPLKLTDQFWNTGIEARFSTTVGYFISVNFILGYYLPFSPAYAKSGQTALSLQIGGF